MLIIICSVGNIQSMVGILQRLPRSGCCIVVSQEEQTSEAVKQMEPMNIDFVSSLSELPDISDMCRVISAGESLPVEIVRMTTRRRCYVDVAVDCSDPFLFKRRIFRYRQP